MSKILTFIEIILLIIAIVYTFSLKKYEPTPEQCLSVCVEMMED